MGVKISELNEASSVQNSDVLPIVQNGETKKVPVETLGSQKVNKTGDTLTGELQFNNKSDYGAIRKTRTVNGVDYEANVGISAAPSTRIELKDANDNLIGQLDIRADGYIWNGKTGNRLVETKSEINYGNWHSVVLTRSDNNYLYIMLYGSDCLKEGTYSIPNGFALVTYGTTSGTLTIPTSAIHGVTRRDWGFEVVVNRSGITGITSGQYNGIAIVSDGTLTLRAT